MSVKTTIREAVRSTVDASATELVAELLQDDEIRDTLKEALKSVILAEFTMYLNEEEQVAEKPPVTMVIDPTVDNSAQIEALLAMEPIQGSEAMTKAPVKGEQPWVAPAQLAVDADQFVNDLGI
jgi:hypothetical protein